MLLTLMRKKCCTSLMNAIIIALQYNLICFHMDNVPLEMPSELSIFSLNGRSFWETIKSAFNSVNYQSVIVCWCPYSARKLAWKLETVYSGDKCLSHFILSIWLLTTYPRFFIHVLGVICARQEYMDSNGSSSFCLKRGNWQNLSWSWDAFGSLLSAILIQTSLLNCVLCFWNSCIKGKDLKEWFGWKRDYNIVIESICVTK